MDPTYSVDLNIDDGDISFTVDELLNNNTGTCDTIDNEPKTPTKDVEACIEVGMEFSSRQLIYEAYNTYARLHGFGVRKRNSKSNYILLTCSRSGFYSDTIKECYTAEGSQRRSSFSRIGCKAALHAYKDPKVEVWKITKFTDAHNHEMVTPRSVVLLRSHKYYSSAAKSLTESFSRAGVPLARVPNVFGTEGVPFDVRDCYNHMQKVRRIIYEAGDAQAVQLYCTQQQQKDPNFFYSIQLDDDSRMLNFCWIDPRSRKAYEQFGDAVTFDTTYRTNKYSMPFAPFVGINHHLQSILFGCALLHDETIETFTWVFETWLSAMKGKAPTAIITDQDIVMGKAIAKVFPGARHRLCMWHIMKKFPEKLAHLYHEDSDFKTDINAVIYQSKSTETFEQNWMKLLDTYKLQDNEWLKGLFEIRNSWIPVYNRGTFYAGMNTTQRSESINSFFEGFVHSGITLREFVVKYDCAVSTRYESFRKEEFDTRHKERRLTLNMALEEHAAKVYTRNVFLKVHEQLSEILKFSKEKTSKVGSQTTYRVWDRKNGHDDYEVKIDFTTLIVSCSCQMFEFLGILCRHIFAVFHAKSIEAIPSSYILRRWSKDGNKIPYTQTQDYHERDSCMKSMSLHIKCVKLQELAARSEEIYKFINDKIDDITSTVTIMPQNDKIMEEFDSTNIGPTPSIPESHAQLRDPVISQTKGRKRLKSSVEQSKKSLNICGKCGKRGHNRRGCKSEGAN